MGRGTKTGSATPDRDIAALRAKRSDLVHCGEIQLLKGTKVKKTYWALVLLGSTNGIGRLEFFASQSDQVKEKLPKETIPLTEYISCEALSKDGVFRLQLRKGVWDLKVTPDDRNTWVTSLQHTATLGTVLHPAGLARNISQHSTTTTRDSVSSRQNSRENAIYSSIEAQSFDVQIDNDDCEAATVLGFPDFAIFQVTPVNISLRDVTTHATLATWPLRYLRRYGIGVEGDIYFEAGRRCPTGAGYFNVLTSDSKTILELLDRYTAMLSQTSSLSSSVDPSPTVSPENRKPVQRARSTLSMSTTTTATTPTPTTPTTTPPPTTTSQPDKMYSTLNFANNNNNNNTIERTYSTLSNNNNNNYYYNNDDNNNNNNNNNDYNAVERTYSSLNEASKSSQPRPMSNSFIYDRLGEDIRQSLPPTADPTKVLYDDAQHRHSQAVPALVYPSQAVTTTTSDDYIYDSEANSRPLIPQTQYNDANFVDGTYDTVIPTADNVYGTASPLILPPSPPPQAQAQAQSLYTDRRGYEIADMYVPIKNESSLNANDSYSTVRPSALEKGFDHTPPAKQDDSF